MNLELKAGSKSGVHVVVGAGPLGLTVTRLLADQGYSVRIISRNKPIVNQAKVEWRQGDIRDSITSSSLCEGAAVIYNCVGLPYKLWSEQFPLVVEGLLAVAESSNAVLVHADNLYAYGPTGVMMTEDASYHPVGIKTRIRGVLANTIMDAHQSGKVRAVIGRGSDFYGPGVMNSSLGTRVFGNALQGKPAELLGDLDTKHTYLYIDDFARALIQLGRNSSAWGNIWHVPSAPTITTRQIVTMIYEAAGQPLKVRVASKGMVFAFGIFLPFMRELKEMMYQFTQPFIVDDRKYTSLFGAEVTPHHLAIEQTLDWYRTIK